MTSSQQTKRLCIYFYYDPEGIVDDYILDVIRAMKENCLELVVVCNGKLTQSGRDSLISAGATTVLKRKNVGFDVWAYKYALEKIGWRKLVHLDEVILMNFTIMGPIYPLSEMFSVMDEKKVDFWGLTIHHGEPYDPWGTMPQGVIPKHLQSHFIAIRKRLLCHKSFREYWDNMRMINSYTEAIAFHEAIFTQTFAKKGFRWKSYVKTDDLASTTSYPLMFMPIEVLKNRRCPFFKRKAFFLAQEEYLGCTSGETPADTLDFLVKIGYDTKKIFRNINRSCNQFDLRVTNQLVVFPQPNLQTPNRLAAKYDCVLAVYLDDKLSASLFSAAVGAIGSSFNISVTASKAIASSDTIKSLKDRGISLMIGSRREYLDHALSLAKNHTSVGFASYFFPRKTEHPLRRRTFLKHSADTIFKDSASLHAMLSALLSNPHAGMVASIKPIGLGPDRWDTWDQVTYKHVQKSLQGIGYGSIVNASKSPLAPVSGFFLIRSSILNSVSWQKTGLLGKNALAFNCLLHALPFIVQSVGYITLSASSSVTAKGLIIDSINHKPPAQEGISIKDSSKVTGRKHIGSLTSNLYWTNGKPYSEIRKLSKRFQIKPGNPLMMSFTLTRDVTALRYDPVEGIGSICKNVRAWINNNAVKIEPVDVIRYGNVDIFLTSDPQYSIQTAASKGDVVTVTMDDLQTFSPVDFLPITEGNSRYAGALRDALAQMNDYYSAKPQEVAKKIVSARSTFI